MSADDWSPAAPPPRRLLPSNVGRVRLIAVIEIVFLSLSAAIAVGDVLIVSWAGAEVSSIAPKHIGAVVGPIAPVLVALALYALAAGVMIGAMVVGLIRLLDGRGGARLIAGQQIVLLGVWLFTVASGIPVDPGGWFLSALLAAFPLVTLVLLWSPSVRTHAASVLNGKARV